MLGLRLEDGGEKYEVVPHTMGVQEINAKIPVRDGWLLIQVKDENVVVNKIDCAPQN